MSATTVFLLGRPGCGKSSAAKYISKQLQSNNVSTDRLKDFDILKEMMQEEQHKKKFRSVQQDGFDVLDGSVLEEALQRLSMRLVDSVRRAPPNEILFVEFAREDYEDALLKYFPSDILQDAYFLFIDVDLDKCIERIEERMHNPTPPDDHYISQEKLREYYTNQKFPTNATFLGTLKFVDNNGSEQDFMQNIDNFVKDIFK